LTAPAACPIRIRTLLTDNGAQFTDPLQWPHQRTSAKTRFAGAAELEQTLNDFSLAYNHFIPQQAIGHRSPIDALTSWYDQHPELFIAPVMI
jgi:transposase InsO family protein